MTALRTNSMITPAHSRVALLVVDLQNAYFNNDALRDQQATLLAKTNELIDLCLENHLPVFTIRTEHQRDKATWSLNMIDDGEGYLFKGDEDSRTIPGLRVDDTIEVLKTRDSAFHDTTLAAMLKNHAIETLIICGVSTHTCVAETAADAYAQNFRVILAAEAIASHKPEFHEVALTMLQTEYRQCVSENDALKQYIQNNRQ